MPAWRGRLSPEQARDLVTLIRSFGPADSAPASGATASGQFARRFQQLQQQWDELERQVKAAPRQ
jgi:hypothetical protein